MRKIISVFLFCLITTSAFCQHSIFISGKLKMKAGTTIRFSKISDYISLDRERLSTVKTDKDSCFSTSFILSNQDIINISVNELNLEGLFYPDLHYILELTSTLNEHSGNLLITACNQPVNPQVVLNNAYSVFSDSMLAILFKQNNQRPTKTDADLFTTKINAALKQTSDTFCKALIQSRCADYLTMSRAVNFPSAFDRFFDCTGVPIANPAFQSLLSSNFKMYFNAGPPAITRYNLFQGIPDTMHFATLLKIISVDPSLKCLPVRENVLIENIYDLIKNGTLKTEKGISLFREAALSATHFYNRQVAESLIKALTRQQAGTTIPDFKLIFPDGTTHPMSTLTGKPLHITFFSLKGPADRTLLIQIAEVQHYADSLGIARFVCITNDTDQAAVKKYWAEKKYPMQLCFAPDDYEMIDYFNAYTLPSFILLDSKGRLKTLAPNFPGEQLIKLLKSVYLSDNPKQTETKDQPIPQHQPDTQFLPGSPHPPSKK